MAIEKSSSQVVKGTQWAKQYMHSSAWDMPIIIIIILMLWPGFAMTVRITSPVPFSG
jgi:hypothetical protein